MSSLPLEDNAAGEEGCCCRSPMGGTLLSCRNEKVGFCVRFLAHGVSRFL